MKAKHSAGFRLYHRPAHARPSRYPGRAMAGGQPVSGHGLPALTVSVYPAAAATSMSSLQNKLNKLSQSIEQHKKSCPTPKRKNRPPRLWNPN